MVDLSDPAQPVTKMILQTAGDAFGGDGTGSVFAVADGSAGVTFLDVSSPFAPTVLGTQPAGGTVWAAAFGNGALYAVNEQELVVIHNVAAPVIDRSRITLATTSTTTVSITGAAGSITGVAPFTINVRNARTNAATGAIAVDADGSFAASLAAVPADPLELTVTDGGGRVSQLSLGPSPFGTTATTVAGPAQAANDGNFRARRVASDGTNTIVTSGSTTGVTVTLSGRAVVFRNGSPVNYAAGGAIRDLTIHNGYAYIAGNDLAALNLVDPNATAYVAPDQGQVETTVAVVGSNAFTATANYNDARIRVYSIANPAQPTYVREQSFIGGVTFEKLVPLGTSYLVGISPDGGRDVVLFDVSNPSSIVKLAEVDVPNFVAFDGVVEGTTVYLAGGNAGVAVLDFVGSPSAPSFTTAIIDTPGNARGLTVSGPREIAVADGSAGVTFIDATSPTAPVLLGTHSLGSTNTVGVHAVGRTIYVASDNHFHTITRP